jgi:hypothetical protein
MKITFKLLLGSCGLFLSTLCAAQAPSSQEISASNFDDTLTGWKAVCVLPSCNPGGSGIPTKTLHTIDNKAPSKDGEAMEVSVSGPKYTNALWTYRAGADDQATELSFSLEVYPTGSASSAQAFEFDQYNFSSSTGVEFMWGTQCNQSNHLWQVFDQLHGHWMNTNVQCSLSANTWHQVQWNVHRVSGDTNRCDGMPCMYYDYVIIDGTQHPVNATYPAGHLPHGWSSAVGAQVQIDIGDVGSPVTIDEFIDLFAFKAI